MRYSTALRRPGQQRASASINIGGRSVGGVTAVAATKVYRRAERLAITDGQSSACKQTTRRHVRGEMTDTASTRTDTVVTGACGQVLCVARRAYNVGHHRVDLTSANPVR